MKILVISDSHGHIANLKQVVGFAKKYKVEAIIHCGDWDNVESAEVVLSPGIPLYSVLGNADITQEVEEYLKFNAKKFEPEFLKLEIDGRKVGIIHNVKKGDKRFEGLGIVFSGHYHSKEERVIDFVKFVRPGAIINGINFAVYETETNEVEFISDEET
ncbi:MAG TPA: metallophosphoesterase family protein [Patescibacteria group bacterium]|nr:metallophosphoesterase family protein [Patescibacteria group bacterium]